MISYEIFFHREDKSLSYNNNMSFFCCLLQIYYSLGSPLGWNFWAMQLVTSKTIDVHVN